MINEIKEHFKKIKAMARKDGAQVELAGSESESFSTNFQKGKLHKYSFDQSSSVGVRVLFGKGSGFATTEKMSSEALLDTYNEALQSAKDLDKGANADRSPAELFYSENMPKELKLCDPDIFKSDIAKKLQAAEKLESAAMAVDPRIQGVPYSSYSESRTRRILMNSAGLDLYSESAGISAYSYVLSKAGDESKGGFTGGFFRNPGSFNPTHIAKTAAQKALSLLGAEQPKSGNYAVVLLNEVAADMLDFLNDQVSAQTVDQGISLFKGKLGQQVVSEKITLVDDPFQIDLPGARPFDSEGAASQKTKFIENGVLKSFLTNSYLSKKMHLPHTSNATRSGSEMGVGPSNTIVSKGRYSLEDLLASFKEVIFITSVEALHSGFKETTLDFSLPAYGFLYQQGKQMKPLHQMVMSGNLLQILNSIEKMSDRYNTNGNTVLCPDLLIPSVSIAGN